MAKDPAMPLYINDWLGSPRIALMTAEQERGYLRLLLYCWASGDASLPDDEEELAVLSKMGEGWLKGGSHLVRKCFEPHPHKSGFLTNKKLLELWNERQEWRRKSSIGGQLSAASRRRKKGSKPVKGGSQMVAVCFEPNGNSSSSSSSSSVLLPPTGSVLHDDTFIAIWTQFISHCAERGRALTATRAEHLLMDLTRRGLAKATADVRFSIAKDSTNILDSNNDFTRKGDGQTSKRVESGRGTF